MIPETDFAAKFQEVDELCPGASGRVRWPVQKAVLDFGDPTAADKQHELDLTKYELPPLNYKPRLGVFETRGPKLNVCATDRGTMETYLEEKFEKIFWNSSQRGVKGMGEITTLADKLSNFGSWDNAKTRKFDNFRKLVIGFDDLLAGKVDPHGP
jgi:hypothetical protein